MFEQRIHQHFIDSADLKYQAAEVLTPFIAQAVDLMSSALTNGNKILICGNGGSAAQAQHFAAELVGRYERERLGLSALALTADSATLTAIGNDDSFDAIFARQVMALGQAGDVLLAISTSGNAANIVTAVEAAHSREMSVIALTGQGGGKMIALLGEFDVHICVPHHQTARIQEVHSTALHCLCDGVDAMLLGDTE